MKYTVLFLLLFSLEFLYSQSLRAKVVDEKNKPLVNATVYFDGTTRGVVTDLDGYFNLEVPSGLSNPVLVITYLGYTSLSIKNFNRLKPVYQLKPKPENLKNVNVYASLFTRKQMERVFVRYFLGEGKAARQCKILNLDDVILYYVGEENTLYAESFNPVKVENNYLGYNLEFDLEDFEVKYRRKTLSDNFLKETYYAGTTYFKETNTNKKINRQEVYKRSLRNFFKHLADSTLYQTDFTLSYKSFIRNPHEVFEVVKPLDPSVNVMRIALKPDYIMLVDGKFVNTKVMLSNNGQRTTLMIKKPYFKVDRAGNLIDIKDVVLSGALADYRVAKMLPLNYRHSE